MEILILIALFVAVILMSTGKKSNRRSSYNNYRKPKSRPKKTKQVKQYEFNPKFFKPFEGKAHVIDGDTIVVKRQKIRLAGVNAPELDQAWGQKSKWEMVKILKGKVVRVVPNGETSFDRIVATCYIDGDKDIGAELISRGLARDIPAFTGGKYKEFEELWVKFILFNLFGFLWAGFRLAIIIIRRTPIRLLPRAHQNHDNKKSN